VKRTLIIGIIIIAIIIAVVGYTQYYRYYHDDAYISLRLRHGIFSTASGLVWNPGEKVEGYSNFLLIMLVSFLAKLGIVSGCSIKSSRRQSIHPAVTVCCLFRASPVP